jgi:hypothetical protein
MAIKALWSVFWCTLLVFCAATPSESAVYFNSAEESYSVNSILPSSIFSGGSGFSPRQDQGYTRAATGNPKGNHVLEWKTDVPNATDMFNDMRYSTTPPNGGTLYMAFFFKAIRVNGVSVWPAAGNGREGFDKAVELFGQNYRWTLNFGIRAQNGPSNTWSIFVSNPIPGHFNPECEVYDSYWQNFGGYGRGLFESNACQPNIGNPYYAMAYDQWYAVVFGVNFEGNNTGDIGLWINGTKVMQYTNIQTCGVAASSCTHTRPQIWGTYNQPGYNGPIHKRQLDAFIVTDDITYLQSNGYFAAPQSGSGSDTVPPVAPTNLRVQ